MTRHLYVDSSVVISLLFEEPNSRRVRPFLRRFSKKMVSASLLEAEVLASAKREGVALDKAAPFVDMVSLVIPERSLLPEYLSIFEAGYLRGADAYHLAAALYTDPTRKQLGFATADQKQSEIADRLGFTVVIF